MPGMRRGLALVQLIGQPVPHLATGPLNGRPLHVKELRKVHELVPKREARKMVGDEKMGREVAKPQQRIGLLGRPLAVVMAVARLLPGVPV